MRLTSPEEIRPILQRDREWAAYALGDLSPELFPLSDWYAEFQPEPSIVLLFRGLPVPVLFAAGPPTGIARLLPEVDAPSEITLSIRPEALLGVAAWREVTYTRAMWRMVHSTPTPASEFGVEFLSEVDLPALHRLFADGAAAGEAPDSFVPEMLAAGVFAAIREGSELTAVAGTHLVAPAEGVAAIGHVYTRRDRRGRGLAGRVTGCVVQELRHLGIRTLALNVAQENIAALRLYERLGFVRHCPFLEGYAKVPAR